MALEVPGLFWAFPQYYNGRSRKGSRGCEQGEGLARRHGQRLVYAASDGPASGRSKKVELALVGVGNKSWNFGNILW